MYLPTTETRWFYKGSLPEEMMHWYMAHEGECSESDWRDDFYLFLPGNHKASVKTREGRLEVKQRVKAHGIMALPRGLKGEVSSWRKWGFYPGDQDIPVIQEITQTEAEWIKVIKKRFMYRFAYVLNKIAPVRLDQPAKKGCEVELSLVEREGEPWWSLCFEAFGPEEETPGILSETARFFCHAPPPLGLDLAHSESYPGWLDTGLKE
jgi:hypothetical protein